MLGVVDYEAGELIAELGTAALMGLVAAVDVTFMGDSVGTPCLGRRSFRFHSIRFRETWRGMRIVSAQGAPLGWGQHSGSLFQRSSILLTSRYALSTTSEEVCGKLRSSYRLSR